MIQEAGGTIFLVPVTVGGQDFDVILDTGSSDPWFVTPNYQCVDFNTRDPETQDYCWFGTPYDPSQSNTYTAIDDENINVSYADGEYATGTLGYEQFTMAGITVQQQKFGLMNLAGWMGDGVSSGLIGFAYSTITSAYAGIDPSKDKKGATLQYNTLFTNMWNLSLIPPVFSLVLDRDPNLGGLLALGGIPDIPHSPIWVSTPIQSVGVFAGTTTPAYEYYSIYSDGFAVSADASAIFGPIDTENGSQTPLMENGTVIVDSGTSLLYAPNDVADAVAEGFDPPASFNSDTGMYVVDCTATAPLFGSSVSGKIFFVNGADLLVPDGSGGCISGVQPNNGGLTILGDVWMKNVISVHDIGAQMMRFAAREFYGLSSSSVSPTT